MVIFEDKIFNVCTDREKRDMMIRALETYLEKLEDRQASRMITQRATWLKEEIEKMEICQKI